MRSSGKEPFAKKVNGRIRVLQAFLLVWAMVLTGRLVQLQIFRHAAAKAEVEGQNLNKQDIFPERGTIFDRNSHILARSIPARSIFLTPVKGESREAQLGKVRALRPVLGLDDEDVQSISKQIQRGVTFIYLRRKVSPETAAAVGALKLSGVSSHADTMRSYPNGTLGAHVLGGLSVDNKGQAGVEYSHNGELQGKKGKALIQLDARRREYFFETLSASVPGRDITLTIDETMQYVAERELDKIAKATLANWGAVIVSRPDTGEIMAMASYPTYDPNLYSSAGDAARNNRAIQHSFEPGSTFKIVTASAALAHHRVGLGETFDCSKDDLDIPGRPIRDHKPFGVLTFPEIVINSSNKGIAQVGKRVGDLSLYDMAASLGFGRKTGIDLAGEESGKLKPVSGWSRRTLYSLSMGYEIAATPLQILQAVNIVANRGVMVPPRIIKKVADLKGEPLKRRPADETRRVLPEDAALTLTGILERAVQEGTGIQAKLDGYRIAGKTGTTQKWDPALRAYSPLRHTASFVGFAPADKPVLSVIVVVDEPKGEAYYGGDVAAPIFREVVKNALRELGLYPERIPVKGVITAQLAGEARR
jgi:cell division protein FtsI (penicillin-binding protein 3)